MEAKITLIRNVRRSNPRPVPFLTCNKVHVYKLIMYPRERIQIDVKHTLKEFFSKDFIDKYQSKELYQYAEYY